jgi:hypothetical protein
MNTFVFFRSGLQIVICAALASGWSGCTHDPSQKGPGQSLPVAADSTAADSTDPRIEEVNASDFSETEVALYLAVPTPIKVATTIKQSGSTFDAAMLNPPSKVRDYLDAQKRALNMGVYSADMAYANEFGRRQDALKCFSAVRKLAEGMGVANVFSKELQDRVTANENRRDSLETIFSQIYKSLQDKLTAQKKPSELALMITGGWVESMYLALGVAKTKPTPELIGLISEQSQSLASLLDILKLHKTEPAFATIYPALEALQVVLKTSDTQSQLTPEQIRKFELALSGIRSGIVQ